MSIDEWIGQRFFSKYQIKKKFGNSYEETNGYRMYSLARGYAIFKPCNGKQFELVTRTYGEHITMLDYINMIGLLQECKDKVNK